MSITNAELKKRLLEHVGHKVVIVTYGEKCMKPVNVSLECETCMSVIVDYDL